MQKVVFDEKYTFIPPYRGTFWSWAVGKYLPTLVRKRCGVNSWTTIGLDHLRDSLRQKNGIILCPNHSRASDPLMCGAIVTDTPVHSYAMASWHVFKQSWLETFVSRRIGAFSVYREGMDRKALDTAVDIVATAERPLMIFSEGVISGANDRLMQLMDGTAFIARTAAKHRAKTHPDSSVVVHPVILKYQHQGDPEVLLAPVMERLEDRIFRISQAGRPMLQRIKTLQAALQCAREIQWLGESLTGRIEDRVQQLVNLILQKHEQEWLGRKRTGDTIGRVKDLRIAILTDMVANKVDAKERHRRWQHLADVYYAQSFSLQVPGYLDEDLPPDRLKHHMFEAVERIEEDLTDNMTVYHDLHVDIMVDEAIPVPPERVKSREGDPIMKELRSRMLKMLGVEDRWPTQPITNCPAPPQPAD
ncbi:MAG: 1-acyl-sn-glycerol-3-phosphate acyltransferase [Fuerstiella sp.]